jgi:hypothetical protein
MGAEKKATEAALAAAEEMRKKEEKAFADMSKELQEARCAISKYTAAHKHAVQKKPATVTYVTYNTSNVTSTTVTKAVNNNVVQQTTVQSPATQQIEHVETSLVQVHVRIYTCAFAICWSNKTSIFSLNSFSVLLS